jgi:hypothetical protein
MIVGYELMQAHSLNELQMPKNMEAVALAESRSLSEYYSLNPWLALKSEAWRKNSLDGCRHSTQYQTWRVSSSGGD